MSGFAWVTLATNDSYSLGALVLAHSLKQVGTKHQLAVLITPGVTNAMREKLAAVFNLVEEVNPLDSKDEANLRLLKRPELGITFTKLHCWRLVQFQKCVFLDADTLVLSNSDELFEREEFSAAPDVGWPDCFNSGVFVYKPSNETYSKLVDFALLKGSFDGGDQGLLNLYFSDWAHTDIAKHLPFIYNMCSTAVYSYLPAFKQYGKNAKIVHFIGPAKPWLQYFNTETLTVYPSPGLQHLEDILQMWWNIFCSLIHPNLTREMAGRKQSAQHIPPVHAAPSQPQNSPSQSQNVPSRPQNIPSQPQNVPLQPQNILFQPQNIPIQPQRVPSEPQNIQASHNFSESNCNEQSRTQDCNPDYTTNVWDPWDEYDNRQLLEQSTHCEQPVYEDTIAEIISNNDYFDNQSFNNESSVNQNLNNEILGTQNSNNEVSHNYIPNYEVDSSNSHSEVVNQINYGQSKRIDVESSNSVSIPDDHNSSEPDILIEHSEPVTIRHESCVTHDNIHTDNVESQRCSAEPEIPSRHPVTSESPIVCTPTSTVSQELASLHVNHNNDADISSESGLAGAFAQFTLGAKRSAGQDALENHLRRQAWEVGNIDYLGRDSFDHIWTKICESMAVPVQEAAPQPDAGEKTGAKAPEVIGDVPTADGTQQISCTADAVQPIQETPVPPSPLDATTPKSPAQPDAEPPKTEVSAPVAEGPISLEPSVSVTPETVSSEGAVTKPEEKPIGEVIPKAPIETKQAESASVPSQEPAPTVPAGELSKDVIQTIPLETPKDISPKEVASTDLPKTVEVPPSEVPKTEAVSQEIRKSEAVVAETPKAEAVPVETLKTESAPVEIPKTEVIPVDVSKTETPLETSKVEDTLTEASKPAAMPSETPKIEAVPTTTEETRKPDAPTTEPAPTIPPQAVIAETVSTIVTPPTPTDATELDTPTAEAPPAIPLPDVPKAEVATGGAPPVPEVPSVTEAVPVAEPTKSDIPLPEPLTGIESVPERQKEVPVEETKEGDVISKAEDSTKVEASKPAEAAEAPKKEEKISPKTEEVKSEVIPSEVQQQPIEVAAPQEEIKVEAVTEAALQEEEKKIEAEPPKVEAEASKAEAEAPKAEAEAPKVTGEASKAEAEAPKTTPEAAEQKPEDKPKKKIVKKVKKVPRSEPGAPKVEAATVPEEQPEVAGGEASTPTPPPRKTTTVKKVKAKKP